MLFRYCLSLGIIYLSGLLTGQAQVIRYVSTTGTNTNPSSATSWASSTTNLQGAIAASQAGQQVWVKGGLYKPTTTTGPDSKTISFSMKNGVAIYGGFRGDETTLSQRPAINVETGNPSIGAPTGTTLSGEIGDPATIDDNSFHVISNPVGLTQTAVLDGFIITGGNSNGIRNSPNTEGGGMFNDHASPTIRNCLFQNNQAELGGAIYNDGEDGACSPIILNCVFKNNFASNVGGAVYNGNRFSDHTTTFRNCSFINNRADNIAGALMTDASLGTCVVELTNCSFQGNSSTRQGGAMYNYNSDARVYNMQITNCIFWNNGEDDAIFNQDYQSNIPTINYSLFDNSLTGFISGPGNLTTTTSPFASTGSAALTNCSSVAIDAGDPATTSATVGSTDLVGQARFYTPAGTPTGRIDIGAVEFQQYRVGITAQPAASSAVCVGSQVTVSISLTGTASSYQWYKNGQSLGVAQSTSVLSLPSVTTANIGSYSVVVTSTCNSLTSAVFSLTVSTLPTVSILASNTLLTCTNPSQTLTATSSATALRWSNGETTAVILATQSGSYSVVTTTGAGCTAVSNSISISQDLVIAGFGISSQTVCQGQSVQLQASGCTNGTIRWPDGTNGSTFTTQAGGSTSILTATCTIGSCHTTATGTIVIKGLQPASPVITQLTLDESTCPVRLLGRATGVAFTFTNSTDYVFSNVYRQEGTYDLVGLEVKTPGVYTLSAINTNDCGSSTPVTQSVSVTRKCP